MRVDNILKFQPCVIISINSCDYLHSNMVHTLIKKKIERSIVRLLNILYSALSDFMNFVVIRTLKLAPEVFKLDTVCTASSMFV